MPDEPKERLLEERAAAATAIAPDTPSPPGAVAPTPQNAPPNLIPVRIVDARPPFPLLWTVSLSAVPHPGDGIMVGIEGRLVPYRVGFANFNPFDTVAHVTLGCTPQEAPNSPEVINSDTLKQRMDDYIKSQMQLFDKAEAYSKALILAGYAGLFGVWSFTKDVLTARASEWIALLVGASLLIYVTWEIIAMVYRVTLHNRFNMLVHKTPSDFFKALDNLNQSWRSANVRDMRVWRLALGATVLLGYSGALLLLFNAAAKLIGLPPWP
jgi:hypothetical protein